MPATTLRCPTSKCPRRRRPKAEDFVKRGAYAMKSTGQKVQRYQCKKCGATFTERTESGDRLQHKDINRVLFGLVCSGLTIRRSAILLDVSINTIRSRMSLLAKLARKAHADAIAKGRLKTSLMQFDEMETFLHTKAQPLTIAMAIRARTGQILSMQVGRIPTKGKLAHVGKSRGWTVNQGPATRASALKEAALSANAIVGVACDGKRAYPNEILKHIGPHATVMAHVRKKDSADEEEAFDPLFRLNHTCAKIRADVACMARKTWTTTKSISHLQERLDLYIAWNNKYQLDL